MKILIEGAVVCEVPSHPDTKRSFRFPWLLREKLYGINLYTSKEKLNQLMVEPIWISTARVEKIGNSFAVQLSNMEGPSRLITFSLFPVSFANEDVSDKKMELE